MSYASLTTLSEDNILTGSRKQLEQRYKETLEIEHRVRIQYFQETLEGLDNVTKNMEEFIYITGKYLPFTLERLSLALVKLSSEISGDFSSSINQLQDYVHEYENGIGNQMVNVEALESYQSDIIYFIDFMRKTQASDFEVNTSRRVKSQGQVLQLLLLTDRLQTLTNISYPILSAFTKSKSSTAAKLPDTFWPDIHKDSNCNNTVTTLVVDYLPKLQGNTSQFFIVTQNDTLKSKSFYFYVDTISSFLQKVKNNIPFTLKCLRLYGLTLTSAFNTIKGVNKQFALTTNILTFSIDNLVLSVKHDTHNFHRVIAQVKNLQNKYSANEITKLELAEGITEQSAEKLQTIIDEIIKIVDNQWLSNMKADMDMSKSNVPIWYHQILEALASVAPHFCTSKAVDVIARNMSIWRQPKPELKSSSIIR